MRGHVQGAAIAEQHKVCNGMIAHEAIDEHRPLPAATTIAGHFTWPVGLIATIEIDAEDAAIQLTQAL